MINVWHNLTIAQAIVVSAVIVGIAWVVTTAMSNESEDNKKSSSAATKEGKEA